MTVDGLSVPVLNAVDQAGRDLLAAIHQHAIGRGQPQQCGLAGAKRHRKKRRQILVQPEPAGVIPDLVHAEIHRQPRRHQVARFFDPDPHDRRPVEPPCVIGRLPFRLAGPLVHHQRRIENACRRIVALIKRSQIDERLEGRARLTQCLHRTVEFGIEIIVAAAHRQQPAGMRIQRNDGTFHRGTLRERIVTRLRFKPVADQVRGAFRWLHHDDVADGERIAKIIQRLWPDTVLATRRVGPESQLERNSAAPAIHIDLRLVLGHLGDICGVMILEHGRLVFGEDVIEVTVSSVACQRAAPSLPAVERLEPTLQGHARRMLKLGIERRADRQPPGIEHVFAKAGHDLAAYLLGKIGRLGGIKPALPCNLQRHGAGAARLVPGDEPVLLHLAENPVTADGGGTGLADGVIVRRRLRQCCQIGHFLEGQLVERLVEIVQRRRRNTVASHAEINLVQIER